MSTQIFDEFAPFNGRQSWGNGDTGGSLTILSAQPTKCRIDRMVFSNSDVTDHSIIIRVNTAGGVSPLGTVTVPAGAGYVGVPPVDAVREILGEETDGLAFTATDQVVGEILDDPAGVTTVQCLWFGGLL